MNNFNSFTLIKSITEESGQISSQFLIPLGINNEGLTIANSLRRTLLSSIPGSCISYIKIPGIKSEFDIIPGLREDTIDFFFNLKQLNLSSSTEFTTAHLNVIGPAVITAKSLTFTDKTTILNPKQYLGTLEKGESLKCLLIVERAVNLPIFSDAFLKQNFLKLNHSIRPIVKSNFQIEHVYVQYNLIREFLRFEVTTDGTITPEEALLFASKELLKLLQIVRNQDCLQVQEDAQSCVESAKEKKILQIENEASALYLTPLKNFTDLPRKLVHVLNKNGIDNFGDLKAQYSKEPRSFLKLKGLGQKSFEKIEELLG
jgi:DNA-directed RNA polymerase subunit alpha